MPTVQQPTKVFMFPQRSMSAIPAMQHAAFHADGVGYWVVTEIVTGLLSEEEKTLWEECQRDSLGDEVFDQMEHYGVPAFGSLQEVVRWADAVDAISSAMEEIHVFGAPGECASIVIPKLEAEVKTLEACAVGTVPPELLQQTS